MGYHEEKRVCRNPRSFKPELAALDWLKEENIAMLTLENLRTILDCTPNEVVRIER